MFNGQPKGLYALALANTGERFGYYTMLAIFVLFLQAKFGFSEATTSNIFGGFLALVYFLPLIGGVLADRTSYGKMVTWGIVVMFAGYVALAIPVANDMSGIVAMFGALSLIAIGTGMFKGNLQVLVGNLYDDPKYSAKRDTAFSIFYMAINVGSLFAPTAATKITEFFMAKANLTYNGTIPSLAHQYLDGNISVSERLSALAVEQGCGGMELTEFSKLYINELSGAYHWGFAVACVSLVVSMAIYLGFRSTFKHADINAKQAAAAGIKTHMEELSPAQTKARIQALFLVFAVVVFFWMAFHQNGLTLTFFARDYTATEAGGFTSLGFNVWNLVLAIIAVYSIFATFQSKKATMKLIAGMVALASIGIIVYQYAMMGESTVEILPQIFQQFNPFFVVALTPVALAVFGYLASKSKEPSAPRKIGIGMFIAAIGFVIMAVGSIGMPTPDALKSGSEISLASPNLLIGTYLVLTFAELFLSPMGISFVSKVAPPKYKGAMMGCWFTACAIGNYMVAIIGFLWGSIDLWIVWSILVVLCGLSAVFIFSIMKKLESATEQ